MQALANATTVTTIEAITAVTTVAVNGTMDAMTAVVMVLVVTNHPAVAMADNGDVIKNGPRAAKCNAWNRGSIYAAPCVAHASGPAM